MIRPVLALAVALALLISEAHADAPLPPPQNVVSCASSGEVCAQSDLRRGNTDIINKAKAEVLWSISCWHRWLIVAEDGQSVALCYPGMNLVPADAGLHVQA
ncbi:hypothetical protein [Ideonella sp.]|uniref:hypothetical protein n=1 Tax=Ideonella sp. TaxID=1929293 RepID=UPI003BB6C25C